jgi:hypothetical protein
MVSHDVASWYIMYIAQTRSQEQRIAIRNQRFSLKETLHLPQEIPHAPKNTQSLI